MVVDYTKSKLELLFDEKKDIEEQLEYCTSQKMIESLEEELYNINDSIKILKQAGNDE